MPADALEVRPADAPTVEADAPEARDRRARRIWALVLVVGLLASAPLLLWWGRQQWFFLDEWAFLVNRRLTDVSTVLAPHNGHWVSIPLVGYRVLYRAFGLGSYLPYQMLAVVSHLGVVFMIWLTMRRLRVHPAIATTTALPFALYGAGRENLLFGFQIALTGAIVFGLAQLLVATVDAPTTRRDIVGIALGLAAIMCSAVGIPMVVGAVLAVLIRRGWRAAAVYAMPLGVVYIAWYLAYATEEANAGRSLGSATVSFVWRMGEAAFTGLGQNGLVGGALACLAAVGIARAVLDARLDRYGARPAVAAALVASALSFAVLTGFGRASVGPNSASSEKYIYVFAALLLPVVGLGAAALARRWVVAGAAPLVLLAIGLPGNIDLLRTPNPYTRGSKELVTAVAYSHLLEQLPPDTRLFALDLAPEMAPTAGFLHAAAANGRLPALHGAAPRVQLDAEGVVALHQTAARAPRSCPVANSALRLRATRGTRIVFSGTVTVVLMRGGAASTPTRVRSENGNVIEVRAGPTDLTITGEFGRPPAICRTGPA
jgi:hypothetical protein